MGKEINGQVQKCEGVRNEGQKNQLKTGSETPRDTGREGVAEKGDERVDKSSERAL